jgi:hypothetical protein
MSKLNLVRPDETFFESYLGFISEMRLLGEKIWEAHIPREFEVTASFVARLLRAETSPEAGLVSEPHIGRYAIKKSWVESP